MTGRIAGRAFRRSRCLRAAVAAWVFPEFLRHCLGIPFGVIELSKQEVLVVADADDRATRFWVVT
jgi:hypothetical protein